MSGSIEAVPAYGRDYKTKREVIVAWESGADFMECVGYAYFNKDDSMPYKGIIFRYSEDRKTCTLDVAKNKFI